MTFYLATKGFQILLYGSLYSNPTYQGDQSAHAIHFCPTRIPDLWKMTTSAARGRL